MNKAALIEDKKLRLSWKVLLRWALISIFLSSIPLVLWGVFISSDYEDSRSAITNLHLSYQKISVVNLHSENFSRVWGDEAGELIASLSSEKRKFRPEEPILIWFQLKNVSKQPQTVWHSGFWPNHRLIVRDATGNDMPLTILGEQTRAVFGPNTPRRKNVPITLAPGELDSPYGPYNLRNYFQIGDSVTLHVHCLYLHGLIEVFSNKLVIEVR